MNPNEIADTMEELGRCPKCGSEAALSADGNAVCSNIKCQAYDENFSKTLAFMEYGTAYTWDSVGTEVVEWDLPLEAVKIGDPQTTMENIKNYIDSEVGFDSELIYADEVNGTIFGVERFESNNPPWAFALVAVGPGSKDLVEKFYDLEQSDLQKFEEQDVQDALSITNTEMSGVDPEFIRMSFGDLIGIIKNLARR